MPMITNAVLNDLRTMSRREFRAGFDGMMPMTFYRDAAMVIPSTTASNTYDWLGDFPELVEWIGDRAIKGMKEDAYQISNRLFEKTVGIKRTHIEDDTLGTYSVRFQRMGQAAARHPDIMVAELMKGGHAALCYDGQNFFDTEHPVFPNHDGTGVASTWSNYDDNDGDTSTPAWYLLDASDAILPFIFQERTKPDLESKENSSTSDEVFMKDQYLYGIRYRCNAGYGFPQKAYKSHLPLNGDTLDAAIAAMMSVKGDGDRPLGITPTRLIVPPALRAAANKTVKVMLGEGGASNANFEAVDVRVTSWLA